MFSGPQITEPSAVQFLVKGIPCAFYQIRSLDSWAKLPWIRQRLNVRGSEAGAGGVVTDIWGVGYRHHVFLLAFVNHRATERGGLCGNFPVLQGRVTLSNVRKNQSLDCVWFAAFETNLALCISLWNSEVPGKPCMPEFGEVNFCLGLLIINPVSIAVTMAVCTFHKHRDDASYFQCRARAEPNTE